ncbi:MAG TPA: 1-acyl-sn-glycerol-3-phosphate acyltransferase [Chloroflexi bacterium]|jgi:1-acyl-sn-glycerol-3-phosphate acyltransferase|nr:1-acyl-sn-glycerol-3-phosphate acyltransferase [Chloroflexota bacterium]
MTAGTAARRRLRPPYETSPATYRALRPIVAFIMSLFYRYEVVGLENVPSCGPILIAVNHLHLLDPFAVAARIDRQIVTLAKSAWRSNIIVGGFLRLAGTIFVRRGEVDREALRACLQVLTQGKALAIAPEGTRSKTGALQRAKPGVAYLAARTDAAILPVAIDGTHRLRDWLRLRRPVCRLIIGKPFHLPRSEGKPSTEQLQEMADGIMVRIGALLPEEYWGVYAERIAAVVERPPERGA